MGTERKRKLSLFDVVDEAAVSAKKSNGAMAASALSTINKWNGRPYSQRYYEILEKRKTLPVWHQKEEFLQALKDNQTLILVGETGSGKTTQVSIQTPCNHANSLVFAKFILFYRLNFYLTKSGSFSWFYDKLHTSV